MYLLEEEEDGIKTRIGIYSTFPKALEAAAEEITSSFDIPLKNILIPHNKPKEYENKEEAVHISYNPNERLYYNKNYDSHIVYVSELGVDSPPVILM